MSVSTAALPARPSQTELHQLKWLLGGILSLLALWTLLDVDIAPTGLIALAAVAILTILARPSLVARIPNAFHRIATPLLILFVIVDFILHHGQPLEPLIRMVVLLTLVRCLQYRARREDLQLALLCLFTLIIAGVLSLSLGFGLRLLVFTPVAMALLVVITLLESTHARVLQKEDWRGFRWLRFQRHLRSGLDTRFILFALILYGAVVGLSSLIFISLPRLQIDNVPIFQRPAPGRTGFSDSIHIGELNRIVQDNTIAMSIEPPTRDAIPQDPYWRMIVLDSYQWGRFSVSKGARQLRGEGKLSEWQSNYAGRDGISLRHPGNWKFYLEGDLTAHLPIIGPFESMRLQNKQLFYANDQTLVYALGSPSASVFAYQVSNMTAPRSIPATPAERNALDNAVPFQALPEPGEIPYPLTTLALPLSAEGSETLDTIIETLREDQPGGSNLEFALHAASYLRGKYEYDFAVDVPINTDTSDPIIQWLQNAQTGWCEHFAGSLILICRRAGIPARAVTGFRGASWNDYENYLVVRNRNAHAWVEIYDNGSWVRVDPTPGIAAGALNQQEQAASLGFETGWSAWLDSLRMVWYRSIVSFDEETQSDLATSAKDYAKAFAEALKENLLGYWKSAREWVASGWDTARVLSVAGSVLAVAVLYYALRRLWLLLPVLFGKSDNALRRRLAIDPVRRKAGRLLRHFPDPSQSAHQPEDPEAAANAREAHATLLLLRFGPAAHWPEPRRALREARRALRSLPR